MRRVTALTLVAGGTVALVATGLLARDRVRGGLPGLAKPVTGMFGNGMAYLRWGTGPKTLLWIVGGPGIGFPWGLRLAATALVLRPFTEAGYTCWLVDRKRDMPTGTTIPDMAEDYAALIVDEFGGQVDLVVGEDYGGFIGYYLAGRHSDRLRYLANASSGYAVSQAGRAIDHDIATLIGEGKPTEAFVRVLGVLAPDLRVPGLATAVGAVMGRLFVDRSRPDFASNLMVETEAEVVYDAREVLPDIPIPVLLIGGDRGPYFTREILEETARLIPDCTLLIYAGKGDAGAVSDRRLPRDVLDFVDQRSRAVPRARIGLPIVVQESVSMAEQIARVEAGR